MEDINKEKKIKNGIEPVSIERTEKIINQMKNCVCKIYSNGSTGTGFFTKIPYKNETIKVLITNNHVLDEEEIKNNNIITYIINNNEEDQKNIELNDKRIRYTNKELDIAIIEINEDKDDIHNYIEIDNSIINNIELSKEKIIKKYKNIYKNESVYILNYMNGENIVVSYGLITEINEENGINHKCNTDNGSSGAPILSLKNNKLIGIHFGSSNRYDYNLGTLIIYAIKEFNKIEYNKINDIENKIANTKINKIENKIKDINKNLNELTIIYKIDKNDKRIKLFGEKFIENNKNNCKIIIDNKEEEIIEYININEEMKKRDKLEIKLKEIKTITNMSYMFGDEWPNCCDKLISLPDISQWDTKNVTNMSYMFYYCNSLSSIPDISNWDTQNVTNMNDMFECCDNLISLPDISKWDTKNVTNMSCMFYNCNSLSSLPDISKWDTQNVKDMSSMNESCDKLISLPDISNWNTKNVTNMSSMFSGCNSLSSIPDISNWDTQNVTNMSYMFYDCKSLSSLPDISKWDIKSATNTCYMFKDCNKLPISVIPNKFKKN